MFPLQKALDRFSGNWTVIEY